MVKNKVLVRIGGKDYTLMGTECEEYLQKIALFIDKKLNEITKHNNNLSTSMAAVLTSINVADEYYKCIELRNKYKSELTDVTSEISKLKNEISKLKSELDSANKKNTDLQIELARKQPEVPDFRSFQDKNSKIRLYAK